MTITSRPATSEILSNTLDELTDDDVHFSEVWEPEDGSELKMALEQVDAARDLLIDEIDRTTPYSERD